MIVHFKIRTLVMGSAAQPMETVISDDSNLSSVALVELCMPHTSLSLSLKVIKSQFSGDIAILCTQCSIFNPDTTILFIARDGLMKDALNFHYGKCGTHRFSSWTDIKD